MTDHHDRTAGTLTGFLLITLGNRKRGRKMAYNPKSCNALQKSFYRPVEVAIRWCGLIEYEAEIMDALGGGYLPTIQTFPRWPCLAANTERIFDAITHHDIKHGRDGATVGDVDHVAPGRLTVRHSDLKEWMIKRHPDQKPDFLFDETEQKTHTAINTESFTSLQADLLAAKNRAKAAEERLCDFGKAYAEIEGERDSLKNIVEQMTTAPRQSAETISMESLLKLVAVMAVNSYGDGFQKLAAEITGDAEKMAISISENTVRKWLKMAEEYIPRK